MGHQVIPWRDPRNPHKCVSDGWRVRGRFPARCHLFEMGFRMCDPPNNRDEALRSLIFLFPSPPEANRLYPWMRCVHPEIVDPQP